MRIAFKNYLDDAILTASSTLINRSVDDLKIPHLTRSFSFGSSSGNIVIDLGEEKKITCFVLGGTNLKDGDTMLLQGNQSDEWETPAYSTNVHYYKKNQLLFLDKTYQYWRTSISSAVDMVTIGHIFIGQFIQMPGIDPNYDFSFNRTDSLTLSGMLQPYGDIGYAHFSAKFSFDNIKDSPTVIKGKTIATRSEILEMWNHVGSITPVYLAIWEEDLDLEPPIFCILNQSTVKTSRDDKYKSYKTEINVQETK